MKTSNSPLVSFKKLSPNHSGLRTHKIDTITPHCIVGHLSLQSLGNVFSSKTRKASSNYGIDDAGNIGMYVEEKNRSWCSSSNTNDQRAVTIEIASDTTHPYKITDEALQGLITLCVDICKRNNMPKLLWAPTKALIGKTDKQNITLHRWFSTKACPGDYIISKLEYVATEVNKQLIPKKIIKPKLIVPTKVAASPGEYLVKITKETYRRKGPGMNCSVIGLLRPNEVHTIVDLSTGYDFVKWGKLKNDLGWILVKDYSQV